MACQPPKYSANAGNSGRKTLMTNMRIKLMKQVTENCSLFCNAFRLQSSKTGSPMEDKTRNWYLHRNTQLIFTHSALLVILYRIVSVSSWWVNKINKRTKLPHNNLLMFHSHSLLKFGISVSPKCHAEISRKNNKLIEGK